MRYLGLFLFTSAAWILAWFAGAASDMLDRQRRGAGDVGSSSMPLVGFFLGWIMTAIAFFFDHRDFWGTFPTTWTLRLQPYGFWVVLGLHALLGAFALGYIAYAVVIARIEARRRSAARISQPAGSNGDER